jgi:hypothetical protein
MRLRTLVALPALVITALVVMAPIAAATNYGGDGGVEVSDPKPSKGGSVDVSCGGWMPGSDVTITLHSDPVTLGTFTADDDGNISASVTIPDSIDVGAHTLELTGVDTTGAPRTVTTTIEVSDGGASSLPRTGAAIAALLGVATILFVVGTALSQARKRALD